MKQTVTEKNNSIPLGYNDLLKELLILADLFEKHEIKYVLIGGVALYLHGMFRYTEDLDFIFLASTEQLERIKNALYTAYGDKDILSLSSEDLSYPVIRYGAPNGVTIDMMFKIGEHADYKTLEQFIETKRISGKSIRVLSKQGLLFLKENSLRPNDRQDAIWLRRHLSHHSS